MSLLPGLQQLVDQRDLLVDGDLLVEVYDLVGRDRGDNRGEGLQQVPDTRLLPDLLVLEGQNSLRFLALDGQLDSVAAEEEKAAAEADPARLI